MTDLDTLREQHPSGHVCVYGGVYRHGTLPADPSGCDTRVVLDALEQQVGAVVRVGGDIVAERDAARADADRLAEALLAVVIWLEAEADHPRPDPKPAMRLQAKFAREALRQHTETGTAQTPGPDIPLDEHGEPDWPEPREVRDDM